MPPRSAKKLKKEEEKESSESTSQRRTHSASLDPSAVAHTPNSRAVTTRFRARQEGTTVTSEGLPASAKRTPNRKKSASPTRNTKTSELLRYPANPNTPPEEEAFEATNDLSTLLEIDESDFSTQEISNRTVLTQSRALVFENGIATGPTLKRSPEHKSAHFTNNVQGSANSGPTAGHGSGSGHVAIIDTSSVSGAAATCKNSISGWVLDVVLDRVSKLDGWTVPQCTTKLAAHRIWRIFEFSLLGLVILLFLGPFYTHYQYNHADEFLDNFNNHLINASVQTRNMGRRLVSIEEQIAKLDAIMVSKEELRARQAERRQINWLSQLVGANVILDLTSPAIGANFTIKPSWWSQLWGYKTPTGPGPDAALLPQTRDEPNPTYCVQNTGARVKLQLAASLKRYITPTQLIIEHWPKSEVGSFHKLISAATAPKEVELWVYIERVRTQKVDINALQLEVDDYFPNHRTNEASVEEKLQLTMHSPDEIDHADSWLMVGRWKYDIYSKHNVQKFLIPFDLGAYKVAAKSVIVRVNSNWGSSYATCLLRARLHGIDRSGNKKEEEEEESEIIKEVDGDEDEGESIFGDDLAG